MYLESTLEEKATENDRNLGFAVLVSKPWKDKESTMSVAVCKHFFFLLLFFLAQKSQFGKPVNKIFLIPVLSDF